jgi:hypothetical membrane protein
VSSAAAPVLLVGGWTWAARLQQGGFDPVRQTISALAGRSADDAWVMATALVGVGACHVVTALALRPAATAGRFVLGAGGLFTVAVAAQPLPATGSSPGHAVAAVGAFTALSVWPAVAFPRDARAWAATAVLGGLTAWFFVASASDSPHVGLDERVAAGLQSVVPFVATVALVIAERRSRARSAASRARSAASRAQSRHE